MRAKATAWRLRTLAGALVVALAFGGADGARAQEVSPEARAQLDAAFAEVLKDPTNLDKTYAYAQLATEAGDYEAAITSYERLLLYNPDLPRVKAELGVLYYRLGSFETAKAYFEDALADPDTPPAAQARIQGFLAQIEDNQQRHRFSGSFTFGGRWQSNANFGPDGQVLLFGAPATPSTDTEADDDFNLFAALSGRYLYDLGNDAGDFLLVEGAIYGARQFEFTELDVEHVRLTAGPGFRIYPKDNGPVLLRPHMRATYIRLDDESYNLSLGAGVDVDWQAFDDTTLFAKAYVENREYYQTDERQNADTQDGEAYLFTLGAIHRLMDNVSLQGEVFAGEVGAEATFEAYDEIGGALTLGMRFASPFEGDPNVEFFTGPWSVSIEARYAHREHDGPNPVIAPATREDDDFRLTGTLAVPVGAGWSVFTTLGYQDNSSNLPNHDFDNFSAALGANLRF